MRPQKGVALLLRTAEALFYIGLGLVIFFSWLSNKTDADNIAMVPVLLATFGTLLMGVWHLIPIGQFGWLGVVAPLTFFAGLMIAAISQRRKAR